MRCLVAILIFPLAASCGSGDTDSATDGASGSSGSSTGAPTTGSGKEIDCTKQPQVFPEFDKSCATIADCVIVLHTDCCGDNALGIRAGQEDVFAALEGMCAAQCPTSGCFHDPVAEDGKTAPQTNDIMVECVSGECMTFVP